MRTKYRNPKLGITQLIGGFKIFRILKNWLVYFKDFFGKYPMKTKLMFVLNNGLKYNFEANTFDRNIFNEIWVYNDYNPHGFEIKKNDVVVDIGANIGIFSVYAGHHAKNGKVYAFEPIKSNFDRLSKHIEINNCKNIIAINKAVSNANGKKDIYLSVKNDGAHSFFNKVLGPEGDTAQKIAIATIDFNKWMLEEHIESIDFLKCDCEGAEYEILYSLPQNQLKKIKKISMEVHQINDKMNVTTLKNFLEANDFKINLKPNAEDWILYAKNKTSLKNQKQNR